MYFRGNLSAPAAVAVSEPVAFANANEPTNVHLALTGRAGEMRVSWSSANTSRMALPLVRWGFASGVWAASAPATTRTYLASDLCPTAPDVPDPYMNTPIGISAAAGKGFLSPGELHSALLTALPEPSAAPFIYYSVGSNATGWSDVFRFAPPPRPGAPVALAAVADMGQAELDGSNVVHSVAAGAPLSLRRSYFSMTPSLNTTAALAADVAAGTASLLLHNGDLAYAMGYGALWDVYFERMQAAAAGAPLMTAVGNHEHNWPHNPHSGGRFNASNLDSGGECGVPYAARLPMPPPADAGADAAWYGFDYGAIHFTTISTEHAFAPGSAQYEFVVRDLAAAAAARDAALVAPDGASASAPRWLVFNGHRPFYIDSPYNTGPASDGVAAAEMVAVFEPLWRRYGVDLTLTGHHHSYQRSASLAFGVVQLPCADGTEAGTRHVVIGHGGAGLTQTGGPQALLFERVNARTHGYARIAADASTLTLRSLSTEDGSEIDSFTLRKLPGPRACFPVQPPVPDFPFENPVLEDTTLILALIASSFVALGYGARAWMHRQEDKEWQAHARAATIRMLHNYAAEQQEDDLAAAQAAVAEARAAAAAMLAEEEARAHAAAGPADKPDEAPLIAPNNVTGLL